MSSGFKTIVLVLVTIVLISIYLNAASQRATTVNTNLKRGDQGAYLNFARKVYRSGFSYTGGRNRMPLYPFLQALLYSPDLNDQEFFARGKAFNTYLSILLLIFIFFVLRRYFALLQSYTITVITAFTVFVFKAPYFQAELLYYTLFFFAFLTWLKLLESPDLKTAVLSGTLTALAHLTKASVLPGLVIYFVCSFLKSAGLIFASVRKHDQKYSVQEAFSCFKKALTVLLVFLVIISPYELESKKRYGRFFYNVNSNFYMWMESWQDVVQNGPRRYGDRIGWPSMPSEQIPGPIKYFKEHTLKDIFLRLKRGAINLFHTANRSYGFMKYIEIFALLAIILSVKSLKDTVDSLKAHNISALYVTCLLLTYFSLFAFYNSIVGGIRFVLTLFLPLMFIFASIIENFAGSVSLRVNSKSFSLSSIIYSILLLVVLADINFIYSSRIFQPDYGL
ncbi:MAG: hypothetical protein D6719_08080 [Candidatus Dadabacteria bacterium]|nr:MAG: hypothetical protein D6719_08080 [Candidatus Dadabacteria bacterium]